MFQLLYSVDPVAHFLAADDKLEAAKPPWSKTVFLDDFHTRINA